MKDTEETNEQKDILITITDEDLKREINHLLLNLNMKQIKEMIFIQSKRLQRAYTKEKLFGYNT